MIAPRFHHRLGCTIAILAAICSPGHAEAAQREFVHDVVIYGGTSAGIAAAVQTARMGKSVIVVGPDKVLGGLSSGGLGYTDSGNKAVIGGLAREFYHMMYEHYRKDDAWRWQPREAFGNRGQGTPAMDGEQRTMWLFEPHVAARGFEDWVTRHKITVHRDEWLDRKDGVKVEAGRIASIRMLSGKTYRGRMFIDATYEGDLMAAAGVTYTVGREANAKYGETLNGVQHENAKYHQFDAVVDPYVVPGDKASGLLPRIHGDEPGRQGEGDRRLQAYCYRMCLTTVPENRVPFSKPANYDPMQYELLARYLDTGWRLLFRKFDDIPNGKTDTNNHGAFSTDNIGMNYDYPEASYERRREILREHRDYQMGWFWFLANDPRVPEDVRRDMSRWGLAKDEFVDNDHWPHQIYVREARRMVSDFVMTELHVRRTKPTPHSVGMGSYNMDSHHVQRFVFVDAEGRAQARNEGDVQVSPGGPYPISYGAIVPREKECANLLVPVCLSSSHIAYGSIRMEPVFMILGQSAATAAVQAIADGVPVQRVDYARLERRLRADGQVLEWDSPDRVRTDALPGTVIDDAQAEVTGTWSRSSATGRYVGAVYLHDGNADKGTLRVRYAAPLAPGRYEVRVSYTPSPNRATNVPVTIHAADGGKTVHVNQRRNPGSQDAFVPLGTFALKEDAAVVIANDNTDGYVVADAVQFVPR